jgi:predicted HTH domain antitoxin
MSVAITIDLPETVFSAIRKSPSEFAAEMRLAAAVKWYEMGVISQEKAAEIAGRTRADFILSLARFGVSPFQSTADEIMEDLRHAD